jgi:hypothetical protein
MEIRSKLAILESLLKMDDFQAEKVLNYMRSLPKAKPLYASEYERFKQQALKEIRNALKHKAECSV